MKTYRCACLSILLLGAAPISAHAQAAAETALGVGRAATMAAPLKNAGKRIGAVLDNAGKSMETRRDRASSPNASAVALPPAPQPLKVAYEAPIGIKTGMDYEEVLRRFGPPPLMLTTAPGSKTLCYGSVDVEVREGKVVSVRARTSSAPEPAPPAPSSGTAPSAAVPPAMAPAPAADAR